ncbi:Inherit from NOG: Conserved hypothetical, protein [Seminavis robusta]|uniref:Inherit from NOG: Conserved hypothetical, protein n=1 Tax=Seminavis robusta TaxID=568900 RepID=A0A9N8HK24_9STRA|nr:Inherit from NOG: Conserved hypothetical, protein [Seminavis robusta]|eukprot:Sro701_g189730.1 Inherit from NOG: Conserved hypothetical, protein (168) ;mRNA; f:3951-4454
MKTSKLILTLRSGSKPETTSCLPHSQLNQHGPPNVIQKLHEWCFAALPHVVNEPSGISVPGARALVLHKDCKQCNQKAFMINREFAHIHPAPDLGSLHVVMDAKDAADVKAAGWGEDHYLVTQGRLTPGFLLVYSPRDENELETVKFIVGRSYEFATGKSLPAEAVN